MSGQPRVPLSPAHLTVAADDAAAALGRALEQAGLTAQDAPRVYIRCGAGEPMTAVVNVGMAAAEAAALADRLNESVDRVEVTAVVESLRELADGWEWHPADRAAFDALLAQLPGGAL